MEKKSKDLIDECPKVLSLLNDIKMIRDLPGEPVVEKVMQIGKMK